LYNVTGVSKINLFVYRFGSGSPIASREVFAPGGTGIRNINAVPLRDGFYGWHFFATLNGNTYNLNSRESIAPLPISAPTSVANFVIDSTPPETSVALSIISGVNVRLSNTISDITSGLISTQVYFNRVLPSRETAVSSTNISGAPTNSRVVNVDATVAPGATYEYFAVTTDTAGNIATSSVNTYVAGGTQSMAYLQSQSIRLSRSPYPAGTPISIFGDVKNVSLIPVTVPFQNKFYYSWDNNTSWIEQSTINRPGLGAGLLLTDSATFIPTRTGIIFFRHCVDTGEVVNETDERVIRKCSVSPGIRVTAGAGIADSIPLTCNPGFEPDLNLNVCKLIVAQTTLPLLVSRDISPPGPIGSPRAVHINLRANVINLGSVSVDVPFRNQLYYSWDNNTNWVLHQSFNHTGLPSGLQSTNNSGFSPSRIGDLYFRHCVDVDNSVDEADENIASNCSESNRIDIRPTSVRSANCIITTGNSTCDTTFTWNITGAPRPNIFNETSSTQYSTAPIGTDEIYAIQHGENKIVGRNGTAAYWNSRTSVFGSCELGASWDSVSEECKSTIGANAMPFLVDPIISVIASSNLIRSGTTAGVKIEITGNGDLTCKLTGVVSNEIIFTFRPDIVGIIQTIEFDYTTRPLFSAQIVNLECTGTNGDITTGQARINVVGITQEI
jgi:hypothetical protein